MRAINYWSCILSCMIGILKNAKYNLCRCGNCNDLIGENQLKCYNCFADIDWSEVKRNGQYKL